MGAVMREFARTLLRNYEDFVTRFSAATAALHDSRRDSRAFGESLDGAVAALLGAGGARGAGGGGGGESLEAYLILPVQRLMRYTHYM